MTRNKCESPAAAPDLARIALPTKAMETAPSAGNCRSYQEG